MLIKNRASSSKSGLISAYSIYSTRLSRLSMLWGNSNWRLASMLKLNWSRKGYDWPHWQKVGDEPGFWCGWLSRASHGYPDWSLYSGPEENYPTGWIHRAATRVWRAQTTTC